MRVSQLPEKERKDVGQRFLALWGPDTTEAGVGTVFTVRLPVHDNVSPRDTQQLTEATL